MGAELKTLQRLCPKAEERTEGGVPVVFLPGLQIEVGKKKTRITRDALLWPHERDGYPSRLFVSEVIAADEAKNWNVFNIMGRSWHACSWSEVPNNTSLVEMLANHLRAFR